MVNSKTAEAFRQSDQVTSIVTRASTQVAAVSDRIFEVTESVNSIAQSIGEINVSLIQSARNSRRESQIAAEADNHTTQTIKQMEAL